MTMPVQTFRERMEDKQSVFKTEILGIKQMGLLRGNPYPHVLPEDAWSLNLWREIAYDAIKHFAQSEIVWHPSKHNMLSSQVLCANIFYPLREHLNVIHTWMQSCQLDVGEVVDLNFNFVSHKNYLHERDDRGLPPIADLSITWVDMAKRRNLLLLSFKFAEANLGECSPAGNPNPKRCYVSSKVVGSPRSQCYRVQQGRRYWDVINSASGPLWKDSLVIEKYCPFRYDFFHLMRGQLLAHCIQSDSKSGYDRAEFGILYHASNSELLQMALSFDDERNPFKVWPTLLHKPETFHAFTLQDFFATLERSLPLDLTGWRQYLNQRYGL